MILAFHPTQPLIPGIARDPPSDWQKFVVPWSKSVFKHSVFGNTLIQELTGPDFGVFIWTLEIHRAICLYPMAVAPTIALQFTIDGVISCVLSGYGDKILQKGTYELFYVPMGHNEAWFVPGWYESLHIELKENYLEELVAVRPDIEELVSRLKNASANGKPMAIAGINYITKTILKNLRNCIQQGPALHFEIHKFILELLSEYLAGIKQTEADETRENSQHKKLMIQIKDHILLSPNIHEHTVEKLAEYFNISQSLLKREFKRIHGKNISAYVHHQVMNRGQFLLSTSRMSIEDIAEDLGYAWRPAFEQAFKKYFNYSPRGLRRDLDS
jgi:AraC-like DNA-binding protein